MRVSPLVQVTSALRNKSSQLSHLLNIELTSGIDPLEQSRLSGFSQGLDYALRCITVFSKPVYNRSCVECKERYVTKYRFSKKCQSCSRNKYIKKEDVLWNQVMESLRV